MAGSTTEFVVVNGERVEVSGDTSLGATLARFGVLPDTGGVAVAVNGAVVPRSQWAATALGQGAQVEIVRAVQGG